MSTRALSLNYRYDIPGRRLLAAFNETLGATAGENCCYACSGAKD
jgi:hypothetical protein